MLLVSDPLVGVDEVSRPLQGLHGLQSHSQKVKDRQGPKSERKSMCRICQGILGQFPTLGSKGYNKMPL